MVEIITKSELLNNINKYKLLLFNSVFITPTDTVYGLSCNATNDDLIKKVLSLKQISSPRPFSIIVPNKEWIFDNCVITPKIKQCIDKKLPGPYTFILKLKKSPEVSDLIINHKDNSIGIRLPDHWISDVIAELGVPFITTTANITGQNLMTSLDDLESSIKNNVDLIINVGEKKGHPSTLIYLVDKKRIVERK